jgi:hypothetical protein
MDRWPQGIGLRGQDLGLEWGLKDAEDSEKSGNAWGVDS